MDSSIVWTLTKYNETFIECYISTKFAHFEEMKSYNDSFSVDGKGTAKVTNELNIWWNENANVWYWVCKMAAKMA